MTPPPNGVNSRVARRIVLLFAGAALVPLMVFAGLAVLHVTRQTEADLHAKLHDSAKSAGMSLAARLGQIAGDLALTVDLAQSHREPGAWVAGPALLRQIGAHCRSLQLWAGGEHRPLYGDDAPLAIELSIDDREHLASGKPVARFVGSPPELIMFAATDPARPDDVVVARVRNSWLWDPAELRGVNCDFAAFDELGRLLYDTFDTTPPTATFVAATHPQSSAGTFRWTIADQPHLARYWRAFLQPQYRMDLLVVQSQSAADATAVGDAFVRTFWLTAAGTLLLIVLASLVQIRRTLGPIGLLREAAERFGRGDLDVRVGIARDDEFGELGRAFDDMAEHLQTNIERRKQTERELVASRDAALAAVRAKATFLTNVSHELRTPMAEILSAAEILTMLEESEVEAREEFSGIALKGAQRLSGLLDDVLALGDDGPGEMAPTDVGAAVRDAVAGLPADPQARVTVELPAALPRIHGNAARLTEVFARLLDNAVKFSAADTPIEVRGEVAAGHVAIAVKDRGAGIDPADHERIFEPFCQVGRDQLIDKASGTGLGLTLARSIVVTHGGTIEVDSTPGRGSTFRVMLPLPVDAELAPVD